MSKYKRSWKLPGTTLLELVIALAILGIISGPMIAIINAATQSSVKVREASVATYTAKLCVEQMVNLTRADLNSNWVTPGVVSRDVTAAALIGSNEFLVRTYLAPNGAGTPRHGWITYTDPVTSVTAPKYFAELSEITVEVYTNKNGALALMCSYGGVIFTGASHTETGCDPMTGCVSGCALAGDADFS